MLNLPFISPNSFIIKPVKGKRFLRSFLPTYLANSASCLGSERSMPGIPPGGSFFPVMYSE